MLSKKSCLKKCIKSLIMWLKEGLSKLKGLSSLFIETKISAKQVYFGAFSNPNSKANFEMKNKLKQLELYVKQNIFSNCLQVLLSILRSFKLINMHFVAPEVIRKS